MGDRVDYGPRIDVRPLFPVQHAALLNDLRGLDEQRWLRPTGCPEWTVQEVVAHVLGDRLGRLARGRDGWQPLRPAAGESFPGFLDRINAEWVLATRRLSPAVLLDLLELAAAQELGFWRSIDLDLPGDPVSWAGPEPAPRWLDAARDFTEYWTHHRQIAEATGCPGPPAEHLAPVLDTFLRGLPHTLRTHVPDAPEGATVAFTVTGPDGGTWTCLRGGNGWTPAAPAAEPAARVELDPDSTWRLCTRALEPAAAAERAVVHGERRLADAALRLLSIIRSP